MTHCDRRNLLSSSCDMHIYHLYGWKCCWICLVVMLTLNRLVAFYLLYIILSNFYLVIAINTYVCAYGWVYHCRRSNATELNQTTCVKGEQWYRANTDQTNQIKSEENDFREIKTEKKTSKQPEKKELKRFKQQKQQHQQKVNKMHKIWIYMRFCVHNIECCVCERVSECIFEACHYMYIYIRPWWIISSVYVPSFCSRYSTAHFIYVMVVAILWHLIRCSDYNDGRLKHVHINITTFILSQHIYKCTFLVYALCLSVWRV